MTTKRSREEQSAAGLYADAARLERLNVADQASVNTPDTSVNYRKRCPDETSENFRAAPTGKGAKTVPSYLDAAKSCNMPKARDGGDAPARAAQRAGRAAPRLVLRARSTRRAARRSATSSVIGGSKFTSR